MLQSIRDRDEQREHLQHVILLVLMAIVALQNLLFSPIDETLNGKDILGLRGCGFGLRNWLIKSSIDKWGILPLFNPYVLGGRPFLNDPQTAVYYPFTLLFSICPNEHIAIRLSVASHVLVCGLSMYALLIRWKQSPEASLIGGSGFMLSGILFGRISAGHLTFVYGITWIPLTLILYEIAIQKRKAKYVALAALPLSLQIQSGGIITFFHTAFILALFSIYLTLASLFTTESVGSFRQLVRSGLINPLMYLLVLIFTLFLSAPRVLAYIEIAGDTLLPGRYTPFDTSRHMEGGRSIENLFSMFLGIPGVGSCDSYLGLLCLAVPLAVFCIPFMKRNRGLLAFLILLSVNSVLLSMGNQAGEVPVIGPLLLFPIRIVMVVFPFFKLLRGLAPFLIITSLSVPAITTILGTAFKEMKFRSITARTKRVLVYAVVLLVYADLVVFGPHILPAETTSRIFDGNQIYTSSVMEFISRNSSFTDPYRIYCADPPNVYLWAKNGFECLQGRALRSIKYMRFLKRAQGGPSAKLLGMLNVKYVVADHEMASCGLSLVHRSRDRKTSQKMHIYFNNHYLRRIEAVDHAVLVVSEDETGWEGIAQEILNSEKFDPRTVVLVWGRNLSSFSGEELRYFDAVFLSNSILGATDDLATIGKLRNFTQKGGRIFSGRDMSSFFEYLETCSVSRTQIDVSYYNFNRLEVIVTSVSRSFIVISQTRIPGWRIYVNNRISKPLPANDIFMTVNLEKGTSHVIIEFKPLTYEIGVLLSSIAHFAVLVLFLRDRIDTLTGGEIVAYKKMKSSVSSN